MLGTKQLHLGMEPNFTPAKKAYPAFRVDDLDLLKEKLVTAGFPIIGDVLVRRSSHLVAIISLVPDDPCSPHQYKRRLLGLPDQPLQWLEASKQTLSPLPLSMNLQQCR